MDGCSSTVQLDGAELDIQQVIDVAHRADDAILAIYGDTKLWHVEYKAEDDPVTAADKMAHDIIVEGLLRLNPDIPILSEEGCISSYDVRKNWGYYWCVDPLDGTKEFLKRNGEFTVNIALCHRNKVIAGVVSTPCRNEVAWAVEGGGAYWSMRGAAREQCTRLRVRTFGLNDRGLRLIGSRSHGNSQTKEFLGQFKEAQYVFVGSSLKFLMIAKGEADIYPRMAPTCEWDTCAAQIIVTEAGGRVLQKEEWRETLDASRALEYNKEDLLNPHFLVMGAVSFA